MSSDIFKEPSEHLDNTIPDEVLDSPGWQPRLMPSPSNLCNLEYGYDDIVEDIEYMDGD